ncbi:MAG: T9SS type A sorting domain-containing protein, partial [Saprospiraceae bacterium]
FKSIDPATGLQPNNPLLGFLAINDSLGKGQGFVSYRVRPAATSSTGDTIFAQARIVFDLNTPIETPRIFNTIDAVAPSSQISPLPLNSVQPSFVLDWSGMDDAGGCGLWNYDIYVSTENGPFQLWAEDTTATTAVFKGEPGKKYAFFSTATDNVGNQEALKTTADWSITIGPEKKISLLEPADTSPVCPTDSLFIRWTANNVSAFDLRINFADGTFLFQALNLSDTLLIWPVPGDVSGGIIISVADTAVGGIFSKTAVSVYPLPTPMIIQQGDSLIASPAAISYQWFFNGAAIPALATGPVYHPTATGNYLVFVTDATGCTAFSGTIFVEIVSVGLPVGVQFCRLAPNPAKNTVQVTLELRKSEKITLFLRDARQRLVRSEELSGQSLSHSLDLQGLAGGLYYLTICLESGVLVRKVVKLE